MSCSRQASYWCLASGRNGFEGSVQKFSVKAPKWKSHLNLHCSFSQVAKSNIKLARTSDEMTKNFVPKGSFASQLTLKYSKKGSRADTRVEYLGRSDTYTTNRQSRSELLKSSLRQIRQTNEARKLQSAELIETIKSFPSPSGGYPHTSRNAKNLSRLNELNKSPSRTRLPQKQPHSYTSSLLSELLQHDNHNKKHPFNKQKPQHHSENNNSHHSKFSLEQHSEFSRPYPAVNPEALKSVFSSKKTFSFGKRGGIFEKHKSLETSKNFEIDNFSKLRNRNRRPVAFERKKNRIKTTANNKQMPNIRVQTMSKKDLQSVSVDRMTAFTERNRTDTDLSDKPKIIPVLPLSCTLRELSRIVGRKVVDLVACADNAEIENCLDASSRISQEEAELIAMELDMSYKLEEKIEIDVQANPDDQTLESIPIRPPLICVMGHVDHGKTSLLDQFRHTQVADEEAGGITQSIGAFPIKVQNPGVITMLDTPGHAAFNAMRTRGANLVDTVLLVVAADEGVKPQTIESIRLAQSAHVPMVVAINKIDRNGANPHHVIKQLRNHGLVHENEGGDTPMIECSAKTGEGLDELLKTVSFVAEMQEPRAEIACRAEAITLETAVDRKRGSTANVLVRKGTLRVGDYFVVDKIWGKVKRMTDHTNKSIKEAPPSIPVTVYGLDGIPPVGKDFLVVEDEMTAKKVVEFRIEQEKYAQLDKKTNSQNNTHTILEESDLPLQKKEQLILMKGSTAGALEALEGYVDLIEIPNDSIELKVVKSSIGTISESDVQLSKDLDALILGFDVNFANGNARKIAKSLKVPIMMSPVIFKVMDDFCDHLTTELPEHFEYVQRGQGKVKQLFHLNGRNSSGVKPVVAGCHIDSGRFVKSFGFRVVRNHQIVYENLSPPCCLKHFKEKVEEVNHGHDCGLDLGEFTSYEVGDTIQCVERVKSTEHVVPPTFSSDILRE